MPRTARFEELGLPFHVIVQGIERCAIFRDDADRIRFLDGKGEQLTVMEITSGTDSEQYELRHTPQAHFPNFTVSQRAATAILFNGDQALRTIKISLIASELNRIVL